MLIKEKKRLKRLKRMIELESHRPLVVKSLKNQIKNLELKANK